MKCTADRHQLRGGAHQRADRPGQLARSRLVRRSTVPRLVVAHGSHDGAASRIGWGQLRHVLRQMLLDLSLGLDDKSQVRAVAADAGGKPDGERARIPERVRIAGPRAELRQTLLRPRQVVFLLARGRCKAPPDLGIARDERLRAVERLGTDFAGVIDAHQAGGMASLLG
jgi:hypothetical protein